MKILDLLRKPAPTSAELREAVGQLSVASAEAAVAALETQRRAALLNGASDKELDKLEADITSANREVERTVVLIEDITARIAGAEAREVLAHIEALSAQARENWDALRQSYLEYHALCLKLLPILDNINDLNKVWREVNIEIRNLGKSELTVLHPLHMLEQKLRRQPGNLPSMDFATLSLNLPFYRPAAPDNITLAELKNITL